MPVFEIGLDDGRKLRIDADNQETALAGAQHYLTQGAPEKKPALSGIGDAIMQGASGVGSGIGETLKQSGLAPEAGEALKAAAAKLAPTTAQDNSVISKDGVNVSNIPRAVAEQSPALAATLAAARLGARVPGGALAKTIGALVGGVGAGGAMMFGKNAKDAAEYRTGDANAEPTSEDKTRAALTTLPEAAVGALGASRFIPGAGKVAGTGVKGVIESLGQFGGRVGAEAAASGAQDLISQTGKTIGTDKGLEIDPVRALNSAAVGGLTGGLMATPRAAADINGAVKYRAFGGDNADASAAFANRVTERADGQKLTNTKVGREAVEAATNEVRTELSDAITELKTKGALDVETSNALERAKTGTATKSDFAIIDKITGGEQVLPLARQALVAAKLRKTGTFGPDTFTGGLSSKLDKLNPISNPVKTGAMAALAGIAHTNPAVFGLLGAYAPATLAGVYGAYGATRAVDHLTGARSPAARFANRFADKNVPVRPGQPPAAPGPAASPTGPKIRAPGQPWGSEGPPDAPAFNPRAGLLDEGLGRIAAKLANLKKKSMIDESLPLLRTLSQQNKPDVQDPAALQRQQVKEATDLMASRRANEKLQPDPMAETDQFYAADQANAAYDRRAVREQMQGASALMSARRANAAAEAAQEAEATAAAAPAENVSAPAPQPVVPQFDLLKLPKDMTSRAKTLMSSLARVQSMKAKQPEETVMPVDAPQPAPPPVTAKITKANGQVKEKLAEPVVPPAADPNAAFTPKDTSEMPYFGMDHADVANMKADVAIAKGSLSKSRREEWIAGAIKGRMKDQEGLDAINKTVPDVKVRSVIHDLIEELHHTSSRAEARRVRDGYASKLPPEVAAKVLGVLNDGFINKQKRNP